MAADGLDAEKSVCLNMISKKTVSLIYFKDDPSHPSLNISTARGHFADCLRAPAALKPRALCCSGLLSSHCVTVTYRPEKDWLGSDAAGTLLAWVK